MKKSIRALYTKRHEKKKGGELHFVKATQQKQKLPFQTKDLLIFHQFSRIESVLSFSVTNSFEGLRPNPSKEEPRRGQGSTPRAVKC